MLIAIPKESHPAEKRAALIPDTVKKLVRLGADVSVEAGAGEGAGFPDAQYQEAGASVVADRAQLLGGADLVGSASSPAGSDWRSPPPAALSRGRPQRGPLTVHAGGRHDR